MGISGLTTEDGIALCTTLDALTHLETLTLQAKNNEVLKLQTISTTLTHLRCLVLKGQLLKFPHLIVGLPNLTTLCLSLSKLTNDPLSDLHELPNLVSLWLYRAYKGDKLYFEEGGFQRLKLLVLTELHGLNAVEIKEGALPWLEELRIGSSPLLNRVPSGIEHLRSLKVFANYDMPSDFVLSIQPYCLDHAKVEHIPQVTFWYRVEGRSYKMFKLGDSELFDHIFVVSTNIDVQLVQHPYELELSFCDSDNEEVEDDDEEVEDDDVDQLSCLSSSRSFFRRNIASQWSFSSGFYTDDVEE